MSDMQTITGLAIDAFRRSKAAQRVADKAQVAFTKLAMQVPAEDRHMFILQTEVIRFELDRHAAREEGDQETEDVCTDLIVKYRNQIKTLEGERITQRIRALPQCTFPGCHARFDATIVEEAKPGKPGTTGWRWIEDEAPGTGVHEHSTK